MYDDVRVSRISLSCFVYREYKRKSLCSQGITGGDVCLPFHGGTRLGRLGNSQSKQRFSVTVLRAVPMPLVQSYHYVFFDWP